MLFKLPNHDLIVLSKSYTWTRSWDFTVLPRN